MCGQSKPDDERRSKVIKSGESKEGESGCEGEDHNFFKVSLLKCSDRVSDHKNISIATFSHLVYNVLASGLLQGHFGVVCSGICVIDEVRLDAGQLCS